MFEDGLRAKNIWSTTWFAIWYDIPDNILTKDTLSKGKTAATGTVIVNKIVSVQ